MLVLKKETVGSVWSVELERSVESGGSVGSVGSVWSVGSVGSVEIRVRRVSKSSRVNRAKGESGESVGNTSASDPPDCNDSTGRFSAPDPNDSTGRFAAWLSSCSSTAASAGRKLLFGDDSVGGEKVLVGVVGGGE
jgi:hypothetical protein